MNDFRWIFQRTLTTYLCWGFSLVCLAGGILLLIHGGTLWTVIGTLLLVISIFFIILAKALAKWFYIKR